MARKPKTTSTPRRIPETDTLVAKAPPSMSGSVCFTGLLVIPGDAPPLHDAALVIEGGQIAAFGPEAAILKAYPNTRVIQASGFTAAPGLINAHTHAPMSFFRGLGHGRKELIETFLFPAEKALTPELLEPLSYSYLYAGLRAGVTCFADHYYFSDGVARALERFGLRGVVGETVADLGGAFPSREVWSKAKATIEHWPYSPRVRPAVAPHAADTVSAPLLAEMAAFARSHDLPLHMHLSQTQGEWDRVQATAGMSPVAFAARAGALSPRSLVVHLVSARGQDFKLLADSGATVGYCPASQIIYERLAPFTALIDAGVPLAIGTDCAASNDGADVLAELKLAGLLARFLGAKEDVLSPRSLMAMATTHPARTFGLNVGSLSPGKAADIVFYKRDLASEPQAEPEVNLIYSMASRDVAHVMVEGEWLLWQGEPTNVSLADATEAHARATATIKKRVGFS